MPLCEDYSVLKTTHYYYREKLLQDYREIPARLQGKSIKKHDEMNESVM